MKKTIRKEIKELLNSNNILFVETEKYISCNNDKYRMYIIEEDEIYDYSWHKVPQTYFFDISKNNEENNNTPVVNTDRFR